LLRKPLTDCGLRRKRREIALLDSFILVVVGCVALAEKCESVLSLRKFRTLK
jgi:hypothetical protein